MRVRERETERERWWWWGGRGTEQTDRSPGKHATKLPARRQTQSHCTHTIT